MKNANICKFSAPPSENKLNIRCFVRETDMEVMGKPTKLRYNRLVLVSCGQGVFVIGDSRVSFCAGSLIFVFAGEVFAVEPAEKTEYMYIDFDGTRADELFRRFGINERRRVCSGFEGLVPIWQDSLSRAGENTVDLASESMLLYSFSRMPGGDIGSFGITGRMLEYTEQNFADPSLCLGRVAAELGYNPKYISHLFKQKTGVSYTDYLRTLRIRYAVSLFGHGIDSVKNVALLSGFSDAMYFSTIFKKEMGMPPKDYIKSVEKGGTAIKKGEHNEKDQGGLFAHVCQNVR